MKRTGLGLPNGCHVSYTVIDKQDLFGPKITSIYNAVGTDSELSKIIRFISCIMERHKFDFKNIILINNIKVPFIPWCNRNVADCYTTIFDYLRDSIILSTADCKIEFTDIDTDHAQPQIYQKAFFLELIGFRSLGTVTNVSKPKTPYLYVSGTSECLLEQILKLEFNQIPDEYIPHLYS